MFLENKYLKYTLYFVMLVSMVVGLKVGAERVIFERSNNDVEMVLSYKEVCRLALLAGVERDDLFKYIKDNSYISSIVVEEDTLEDYVNDGKATLLRGSEVMNLYRVGYINRHILTHLYKQTRVKPDSYYIFTDEKDDYERIRDYLIAEFGKDGITQIGRWNIIEVMDEKEDLLKIGLGISKPLVKKLSNIGFSVILRLHNSDRLNESVIRKKFSVLNVLGNVQTIIFEGDSVLGYPSQMEHVQKKIADHDLKVGLIEFVNQHGMKDIALKTPKSVVRVHSITKSEMENLSSEKAVSRYVRAAKERGVKILFLHPFYDQYQSDGIIVFNFQFFNAVYDGLNKYNFNVKQITSDSSGEYKPISIWELLILGFGVFTALILMITGFVKIDTERLILYYLLFGLLFVAANVMGLIMAWKGIMAVVTAVLFPSIALISQFPTAKASEKMNNRWIPLLIYILKIVGINFIGALFLIGFRQDLVYLLGIVQFYGVKISFILPILIVGVFFYLRPHRIPSIFYVFKRVFYAPVRTVSLLAGFFCLVFVAIYILRSGNYISFHIPMVESSMRDFLEKILFIRPRTKEFLVGYPFLFFTYYYVDTVISRKWLWFFNVMGAVALISLINSFCHFHTPVLVSLYRSILGVILGVAIGVVYIFIFNLAKGLYKKLT
jgi:hypothetical protein